MRSLYIDTLGTNLQIHDSQNPNIGYWLQSPIEGLDSPEIRTNEYQKPGEDGSAITSTFYDSRGVTLQGIISGSSPTDYENKRTAFATACAIKRDSNGFPVAKRIQFTTLGGQTFYFDGFFRRPVFNYDQINWTKFMVSVVAPQPTLFGSTQVSSGAIVRVSGGGFILPVILPIVSSSGTGGSALITNSGNANSFPVITLTGPLTNPFIYSVATGRTMQLTYTLLAGSTITIDMGLKTIVLNGSSSLLSAKTTSSEWFAIVPGSNLINFSTSSTGDTGNMVILFNPAYLGA